MQTEEQIEKTVKGEKEPKHAQAVHTTQAMTGAKQPPSIWMPPATVPGHDTEIRHWGINE
jgi:hypothetical protein